MATILSLNISPARNDGLQAMRHNADMVRKTRTRWFLREWRKHRGYTQERLAEMAGLSKPYISQLEGGKRQYTQELLEVLADALRCEPPDLIMRDPSRDDAAWSIIETLDPVQRRQVVAIAEALKKAG